MITLDDIRGYATALPEVEERSHFRLPGFRVRDKLVWRNDGRIFVGLRVDLVKAPAGRVRELVEHAWRNKAP